MTNFIQNITGSKNIFINITVAIVLTFIFVCVVAIISNVALQGAKML